MKNQIKNLHGQTKVFDQNTLNTLVSFHIGRGGRFHNSGFKKFIDTNKCIDDYVSDLFISFENYESVAKEIEDRTNIMELLNIASEKESAESKEYQRLKHIGLNLGQLIYVDHNGCEVGLFVVNDGTGCIDIDGDYNTTIVCRLEDCSDEELRLIIDHSGSNEYNEDAQYYGYANQDIIDYSAFMLGLMESIN